MYLESNEFVPIIISESHNEIESNNEHERNNESTINGENWNDEVIDMNSLKCSTHSSYSEIVSSLPSTRGRRLLAARQTRRAPARCSNPPSRGGSCNSSSRSRRRARDWGRLLHLFCLDGCLQGDTALHVQKLHLANPLHVEVNKESDWKLLIDNLLSDCDYFGSMV